MNILIVALELAPYVQRSPAAESVASLSKALRLLGHDVTVAVPYCSVYQETGLMAARQLSPVVLEDGREGTLYDAQLPSGVTLTMVDVAGAQLLVDESPQTQAAPLGAFASAIAALWKRHQDAGTAFDVVHAHDAGAGLSLLQLHAVGARSLAKVLTVHDANRPFEFPLTARQALGIPEERAGVQGFASGDKLCLLKGLVSDADAIVTPSETYGNKLKAPEKYGALSRAFQAVDLLSVTEGVDHAVYNPATDAALVSRYDAPDPSNKGRNKVSVLSELGLEFELGRPVILCEDHGDSALSTVLSATPSLVRNDVTLILSGSKEKHDEATAVAAPFAGQVCFLSDISPTLRRRILAASDFYLSVKRRDPSGQRLLQAARYGAIPIAYQVDAACDVLVDCDAELKTGTGILFDAMTQRALISATARAVLAYRSPGFKKLLSRVMRQDLAWDRSARRHVQIYKNAAAATAQ